MARSVHLSLLKTKSTPTAVSPLAVGDFNNDKTPDLAIPIEAYGKVAILLNTQ